MCEFLRAGGCLICWLFGLRFGGLWVCGFELSAWGALFCLIVVWLWFVAGVPFGG